MIMKRVFLIMMILLLGYIGYSQQETKVYRVATLTSPFGRTLVAAEPSIWYCVANKSYYYINGAMNASKTLTYALAQGKAFIVNGQSLATTADVKFDSIYATDQIGAASGFFTGVQTMTQSTVNKMTFNNSVQATDTSFAAVVSTTGDARIGGTVYGTNGISTSNGVYGGWLTLSDYDTATAGNQIGRMVLAITSGDTAIYVCLSTTLAKKWYKVAP